jgi:hypothetical protein
MSTTSRTSVRSEKHDPSRLARFALLLRALPPQPRRLAALSSLGTLLLLVQTGCTNFDRLRTPDSVREEVKRATSDCAAGDLTACRERYVFWFSHAVASERPTSCVPPRGVGTPGVSGSARPCPVDATWAESTRREATVALRDYVRAVRATATRAAAASPPVRVELDHAYQRCREAPEFVLWGEECARVMELLRQARREEREESYRAAVAGLISRRSAQPEQWAPVLEQYRDLSTELVLEVIVPPGSAQACQVPDADARIGGLRAFQRVFAQHELSRRAQTDESQCFEQSAIRLAADGGRFERLFEFVERYPRADHSAVRPMIARRLTNAWREVPLERFQFFSTRFPRAPEAAAVAEALERRRAEDERVARARAAEERRLAAFREREDRREERIRQAERAREARERRYEPRSAPLRSGGSQSACARCRSAWYNQCIRGNYAGTSVCEQQIAGFCYDVCN